MAKIGPATVQAARELIQPLDTDLRRETYRQGLFHNADKTKDLDRRYRWDLLWASGAYTILSEGDVNDSHIDTALRKIVEAL